MLTTRSTRCRRSGETNLRALDITGRIVDNMTHCRGATKEAVPLSKGHRTIKAKYSHCRLRGVCVHQGSLSSVGHYVTYRRLLAHRVDTRWYRCNDTNIERTPLSDVMSQVAYMLVYDRLPDEAISF